MPYRVLKPIPNGDGTYHESGEIVKADGWRNLRQLINGRYLVEVLETAATESEEAEETPQPKRKRKASSADEA